MQDPSGGFTWARLAHITGFVPDGILVGDGDDGAEVVGTPKGRDADQWHKDKFSKNVGQHRGPATRGAGRKCHTKRGCQKAHGTESCKTYIVGKVAYLT